MKHTFTILVLVLIAYSSRGQDYNKLPYESTLVDTHNDILTTAIDKKVSIGEVRCIQLCLIVTKRIERFLAVIPSEFSKLISGNEGRPAFIISLSLNQPY